MILIPGLVSHEEYFKLFPEEAKHYKEYTSPWKHEGINRGYKVITHGFIKWDDEDAGIWGGPFPGNYCVMHLFKYKSPLLPNIENLRESQISTNKKYKWDDKIPYETYQVSKEKPYKVYLMGNDDASYSKVFGTKTHAIRSVKSLIICPLNDNLLLTEKFVFTN